VKRLKECLKSSVFSKASLVASLLCVNLISGATTYYAISNGNWNSNTTWSLTSKGSPVPPGIYPLLGDLVVLEGGNTVTVTGSASCAGVSFTGGRENNTTLAVSPGGDLSVSGTITIPRTGGTGTSYHNTVDVGAGTLRAGNIAFTNGGEDNRHQLLISTGIVTVAGDITTANQGKSATIAFSGEGQLNVSGAFLTKTIAGTADGGFLIAGNGTVNYAGADQTVHSFIYNNLTFSGSGMKKLSTSMTSISGNLTLSGTVVDSTVVGLSIGGDLYVGDGVGAAAFTVARHDLKVRGQTQIANASTFAISTGYGDKIFEGLVQVGKEGVWNNAGDEDVTFHGGLVNNGIFNAGKGTYTFDTNSQSIGGTISIPKVVVTGVSLINTGVMTVSSSLSGTGCLTQAPNAMLNISSALGIANLSAGTEVNTVNFNGTGSQIVPAFNYYNLQISGTHNTTNVTLDSLGVIGIAGLFLPTSTFKTGKYVTVRSTIDFNGTTQDIPGFVYNNLICSNSSVKTLQENITINGTLEVEPRVGLTIPAGKTITNKGVILLKSNAEGTATLIDNGAISGSGVCKVEQWLPSGRNWYIASPLSTVSSKVLKDAGYNLWEYNEPSAIWTSLASGVTLSPFSGYIAYCPGVASGVVTFTGGVFNKAMSAVTLNRTENGNLSRGFNIVGNSYPSCIDWDHATVTKANLYPTIWLRTKNNGKYFFDTYNHGVGTNNSKNGEVTQYIPPMQAFWVYVNEGCSTAELNLPNTCRTHYSGTKLRSTQAEGQQLLRLEVSNGKYSDETIVRFCPEADDAVDEYDAFKMSNKNDSIPEIYTTIGDKKFVINSYSSVGSVSMFPLGFTTGHSNRYTIRLTAQKNLTPDTQVFLMDHYTDRLTELTGGTEYTFYSAAASWTDRFTVLISSGGGMQAGLTQVYRASHVAVGQDSAGHVTVNDPAGVALNGFVVVYNTMGGCVTRKALTGKYTLVEKTLTPGVYVVTVEGVRGGLSSKVIIR